MLFSILTLFPELISQVTGTSITGRALAAGRFALETIQIRDFAVNSYGKVDDYLFGGGTGMLMMAQPVYAAWEKATRDQPGLTRRRTIYLSPRGQVLNQQKVRELAGYDQLVLICGHYEGLDQRLIDAVVDEELSVGDYVLTGGELAACVVIDAIARLLPGVLPNEQAYVEESHTAGRLEHPQYTRPAVWQDRPVPEILLSGHQARIERWQYLQSLHETLTRRPDLFNRLTLQEQDWRDLVLLIQTTSHAP